MANHSLFIRGNKKERGGHSSEKERKAGGDQTAKDKGAGFSKNEQIKSDNIRFLKEKYYSASEHKTYLAELPVGAGRGGQFGPHVRALVISFYYAAGMSEPKIVELLKQMGVRISSGQVPNLLSKDIGAWQAEARDVLMAGLNSTSWQHIDDTPTRVNGVNNYCHILSNPFYSWYGRAHAKID